MTWPAEILRRARLTRESMASETLIWFRMSSPTVNGRLCFPWPEPEAEPEPGLFLDPEPGDFKPKAFLTLLAAVEVMDRWSAGEFGEFWPGELAEEWLATELRGLPEEVRQAATKISKAVRERSESESVAASWPSGEGRSSAEERAEGFGGIIVGGGGGVSLLEWPSERSLKR